MTQIIEELNRRQLRVARPDSFKINRPDTELRRLTDNGSLLQLSKGFYALIPEGRRGPNTAWIPTIEGAALGMAAALYGPDNVALVGPSAARSHRCYPRALGTAYVTAPARLRQRESAVGNIRFVTREFDKMDTVRVDTDLGPGWATSPEQTALDLCRNRPDWNISESTRTEMIQLLASRIDWELINEIAELTRGLKTLRRLRSSLDMETS